MNKIKKIVFVSLGWNFMMIVLLFFQGNIIMNIIKDKLFPTVEFIKPLFDGRIVEFIKERTIFTIVIIVLILLVELITFFIVNYRLSKKYKHLKINENHKYHKYINIYMGVSVISFVGLILFFGMKIYSMVGTVDLSLNNKAIAYIYNAAMNIEINKIVDIKSFLEQVVAQVKSDSDIYGLVTCSVHSFDIFYYFKEIWIFVSYVLLIYGGFINFKLLNSELTNKKGDEKNEK